MEKLKIPVMQDAMVASISTFHTTSIIFADTSKFSFVGSIPEAMFHDVPVSSKILEGYKKILVTGFCPLTSEMQTIIDEADKPKKGGEKYGKKKGKKTKGKVGPSTPIQTPKKRKDQTEPLVPKRRKFKKSARKTKSPSPCESEHSHSDTQSDVRN